MKRNFITVEQGTTYNQITDNGLEESILVESMKDSISISKNCLDVSFVRGDKNNRGVPRVGILHETLLAIADLKYKNNLVPNRHTSITITHLEDALFRLEERAIERQIVGTLGTYQ